MRDLFTSRGSAVDLYTTLPVDPMPGDVAFFRRMAGRPGGPILELGCGTGRVALPLARAGFDVVGLDLSARMLQIAKQKAKWLPSGSRLQLVRGNMAQFRLDRRFSLILIPFRSFQLLLKPQKQRSCLSCVRDHLTRTGRLVVNLFDPKLENCSPTPAYPMKLRARVRHPSTGQRIELRVGDRRCDPLTQTFRETWEWSHLSPGVRNRRRTRSQLRMRWTYQQEMRYLLELSGFKPI